MFYFRFNTDKFVASQQTYSVTSYIDGTDVSESHLETRQLCLGDIESYFFSKLREELGLDNISMGNVLYDVLGIPYDAYSINDEVIGKCDGVLRFTLSEYMKLPIKKLGDKSLQDLGISIEFCKRMSNEESELLLNHYIQQTGSSYVEEEVLWKNLTNEEKVKKFSTYLEMISTRGKELIIVDPYLFIDESDEYCDMIASIINVADAQSIVAITDVKNYRQSSYNKIEKNVNNTIEVRYSNDFHDRFWISNREEGFYTGTSFNGIGKRISLINELSKDDVMEIITEMQKQKLLTS